MSSSQPTSSGSPAANDQPASIASPAANDQPAASNQPTGMARTAANDQPTGMTGTVANDRLRVIITGATGMVGEGVLHECLQHPAVEAVLIINRKPLGLSHPKLTEIIHGNFYDLSAVESQLSGYNACFFCLGVSSVGMPAEKYYEATYTLTMHVAQTLSRLNNPSNPPLLASPASPRSAAPAPQPSTAPAPPPSQTSSALSGPEVPPTAAQAPQPPPHSGMVFCYVSGAGTDSTEKGRSRWARVKGKTENDLMKLPFRRVYAFRPGFIRPIPGLSHAHKFYKYIDWLFPIGRALYASGFVTLSETGLAMIHVARYCDGGAIVTGNDIIRYAAANSSTSR